MGIGFGELVLVLVVVLILFGAGKLPKVMSELGKGVKNFKDGMHSTDHGSEPSSSDKKDSSSQ